MNRQLLTILKKRYGFFLILCILFIFFYYAYIGVQGLGQWKNDEKFYSSEEFKSSIDKNNIEDYVLMFKETQKNNSIHTVKEVQEQMKLNSLQIFHSYLNPETEKNEMVHYAKNYFNENESLLILFISLLGFLLFFFDLKTSFNELFFSSSISKKKIYCYKYLFLALPLLLALLFSKLSLLFMIIGTIPKQYIAVNVTLLVSHTVFSWLLLVFYFMLASFVGLVCGQAFLGMITAGLFVSIPLFSEALSNSFIYLFKAEKKFDNLFLAQLTDQPISLSKYMFILLLCCLLLGVGYWLFPKIALEKKGDYLLINQLKVPTLIFMSFYIPILFTFTTTSSLPNFKIILVRYIFYLLLTLIIGNSIIYNKTILQWWDQKKIQKL